MRASNPRMRSAPTTRTEFLSHCSMTLAIKTVAKLREDCERSENLQQNHLA